MQQNIAITNGQYLPYRERANFSHPSVMMRSLLVFGAMLACMFAYEMVKMHLFHHLTMWESHGITIGFSSIIATIASYVVLNHTERLRQQALAESRKSRRAEEALRASEQRYHSMFADHFAIMLLIDAGTGAIVDVNPAACSYYGYSRAQMLVRNVADLNVLMVNTITDQIQTASSDGRHYFLLQHRLASGEVRDVEVYTGTIQAQDRDLLYSIVHDITERKQAEQQLQHQNFHDALTGLPNRLLLMQRLEAVQKRAQQHRTAVAVLFLDLDNFKVINESLGHEAGDALLKIVANCLQEIADEGTTVARLVGDEFTLLMEGLQSVHKAIECAERLLARLQQPVRLAEQEVIAAASIGIVYSTIPSALPEEMLRDADTAMYHAKANGKSSYILFDPSMNAGAVERMEIETGLRFALEREELCLHYQPLIDLQTGQMTGVEALVRWEHTTQGLMAPGKFIPIAEETGLIIPIGYWVLEEACRQVQAWKSAYPSYSAMTISVNLSGKQLQRTDVVERVQEVLCKTGIAPADLKLEITESVMMADVEDTVAKLTRLKGMGIKLAMDDFGTGYSSMASLNLFPLDTIKIDRSFVGRMLEQEQAYAIIAAIMMLSKSMHLDVTGEGIEKHEQMTLLQGLGCNVGQGFYFSRPLPSSALGARMAAGQEHFVKNDQEWNTNQIKALLQAA